MKARIEPLGRITLVIPAGRLDFAAAAPFQAQLEAALHAAGAGAAGMLIDCAGLDYVSSAGLRVFLLASREAKRHGVVLALCSVTPAVREVLEISGFDQLIEVHADRAAALARMRA